jgi:hypothetical protein
MRSPADYITIPRRKYLQLLCYAITGQLISASPAETDRLLRLTQELIREDLP